MPPSYQQLDEMATWAQIPTNKGKTVELPFREFVLMTQQVGVQGLEWILYRNDGVTSAREWDIASNDVNIIHNTLCAQFPDAEVSLQTNARLSTTSVHLDGMIDENGDSPKATASLSDLAKKGKPSMSGGLRPSQLPALLQSIVLGGMSGNLEIIGANDTAKLYFQDGKLSHCSMRGLEGDGAVVEIVGWESGEYAFYPDLLSEKQTVRNRMENLLMEGMTLVDHYKGLQGFGMSLESYLVRNMPNISEAEFERVVAQGIPADLNFQKSLFQTIDDKTQLMEILRRFPFPKRYWVPTLFNLIHCKLVSFTDKPAGQPETTAAAIANQIAPAVIDWQQVRTTERSLTRSDTGILTYPALLLLLEREFDRNELFNRPFSLVVLEAAISNGTQLQPLNAEGMKAIAQRIDKLKRKTDVITHFEMFGMAILLPETHVTSARGFLLTLTEALFQAEIIPGVQNSLVKIECGVSGIPDESTSLEMLLALAKPRIA